MSYTYDFPRPMVTVDIVVFTIQDDALKVLLIKRGLDPFKGAWALPGGFVAEGESLDTAARRELFEETHVENLYLEQLYTFGAPDRDPRGRVISVSYFALVSADARPLLAATDADEAKWVAVDHLPALAFDHRAIVEYALERLRYKLDYTSAGFQLLPKKFTLSELQDAYEIILGRTLDKRNFRKKILSVGILEPLEETKMEGPHRPAKLYSYDPESFLVFKERGISFPF